MEVSWIHPLLRLAQDYSTLDRAQVLTWQCAMVLPWWEGAKSRPLFMEQLKPMLRHVSSVNCFLKLCNTHATRKSKRRRLRQLQKRYCPCVTSVIVEKSVVSAFVVANASLQLYIKWIKFLFFYLDSKAISHIKYK